MAATSRAASSKFSRPTTVKNRPTQRILWARLPIRAFCSGENSYWKGPKDMGGLPGQEERVVSHQIVSTIRPGLRGERVVLLEHDTPPQTPPMRGASSSFVLQGIPPAPP